MTYVIGFVATTGLSTTDVPGTSFPIQIITPNGTDITGSSHISLTDNTNPADSSSSVGWATGSSRNIVNIADGSGVGAGDSVTLTITQVTNPSVANSAYTLTVETGNDQTVVTSNSYAVDRVGMISGVTAQVSSSVLGEAGVTYVISFVATDGLGTNDVPGTSFPVQVVSPNGTNITGSSHISLTDNTNSSDSSSSVGWATGASRNIVNIADGSGVGAGDSVTLTITQVTNPSVANSAYTLTVETGNDQTVVTSNSYAVDRVGMISGVTVKVSPPLPGVAGATYVISFVATDGLGTNDVPGTSSPIQVVSPNGTNITGSSHISLTDSTNGSDSASSVGWATGSSRNIVDIADGSGVGAGDSVTLTITGVTNPGANSAYTLTVETGNDQTAVISAPYAIIPAGYWMVGSDGGVFAFGNAGFVGSLPGLGVHVSDVVAVIPTHDNTGYWMIGRDGGVFAFGDAGFVGSLPGLGVHVSDIVGAVPTSSGKGYWMVGSDGGVFAFGDAGFVGSLPGLGVHVSDVVAVVPTRDDAGYWMIGRDGGVFAFGDAGFEGSLPGIHVQVSDIQAVVPTHANAGYWMIGADGGVFAFGDAGFVGSLPGLGVHVSDVVGAVTTTDGLGYWMVGSDGGVFAFGDAGFVGSLPGLGVHVTNVVGIVGT